MRKCLGTNGNVLMALTVLLSLAVTPRAFAADQAKKSPARANRGASPSSGTTGGSATSAPAYSGGSASGGSFGGGSASGGGFGRAYSGGTSGGSSGGGSMNGFGNPFGNSFGKSFGSSSGNSFSGGSASRSVTVSENGKTVSASEDSQSGITVKITETVDGTPTTTTVQAANAAELAKTHPAAYELYQRYLGGGKGAQASVNGGAVSSGASSSRGSAKHSSNRSGTAGRHGASAPIRPGKTKEPTAVPREGAGDARTLLRQQLETLRQQHADDPAVANMFDEAIRSLDSADPKASDKP